jgi:hypothetical protein
MPRGSVTLDPDGLCQQPPHDVLRQLLLLLLLLPAAAAGGGAQCRPGLQGEPDGCPAERHRRHTAGEGGGLSLQFRRLVGNYVFVAVLL